MSNQIKPETRAEATAPILSGQVSARAQAMFVLGSAAAFLALYALLRAALLIYNSHQLAGVSVSEILEGFANGVRFDLRVVTVALAPPVLALCFRPLMESRGWQRYWLSLVASVTGFIGIVELDFYREFNQRLNGLAIEYMKEDPGTVTSMIWYGFPVVRYLLVWGALTAAWFWIFHWLDRQCRDAVVPGGATRGGDWLRRAAVLALILPLLLVAGRGTLRQGSPLRWGDAYTTNSPFINNLGLNGTLTFVEAVRAHQSEQRRNVWKAAMPDDEARQIVRETFLQPGDVPYDTDQATLRRTATGPADRVLPIQNVVVILMESFAGRYVGALGSKENITPNFDKLAKEGLLFTRFFSNGTHTHQGMFATMGCFPNLPGFEYLMKTPESSQQFSGLPQLLKERNYNNLYVYNGDFMWDNQRGFFGNQGMTNFIGRENYVNPVFSDPTWGVSDQDMFARAAEELPRMPADKPFYALLQTLSNHTPYALPDKLPVERVTDQGVFNEHLTAMRYSDWALGQFFESARKQPYFKKTLFVILGDHGFANDIQLTDINLLRFHVPLLLIGPQVHDRLGQTRATVGTQTDVVPTIMGRLGGRYSHQCWGRDLLAEPKDDGVGIIKPSGGDPMVAAVRGSNVLIKAPHRPDQLYSMTLGSKPAVEEVSNPEIADALAKILDAYVQTASASLLNRNAGVGNIPSK